ncbi:MAG: hypothetical protein ACE5G1_15430, partial [bacterium]
NWKIQYITYRNGKSISRDISKKDWYKVGFTQHLSIDQAKEVARQLNAQEKLKREQERRLKIQEKQKLEDLIESAFLPPILVMEFEEKILLGGICPVS